MSSISDAFEGFLGNRVALFQLAWLVTLLCVFISATAARVWLRNKLSLYNAMALLACVWMLVLPTYAAPSETRSEQDRQLVGFASDLAAVLLVYVGGLLVADVRARRAHHTLGAPWELRVPLALLLVVAIPSAITIPGDLGEALKGIFGFGGQFSARQVSLAVGEFLVVVAFVSVARGVYALNGASKLFALLIVVLFLYALTSIGRAVLIWEAYYPAGPFPILCVTAAKLAMTVVVTITVLQYAWQLKEVNTTTD